MSWRGTAEGDDEPVVCFFLSLWLPLSSPLSVSLSPHFSDCRPDRTVAQRGLTASFIYWSIFSPSRAQLYLTNMSSSPARVVQWDEKEKEGAVQWEGARGEEGGGLHETPIICSETGSARGSRGEENGTDLSLCRLSKVPNCRERHNPANFRANCSPTSLRLTIIS